MDYISMNRTTWDHRAKVHLASKMYNLDGFLKGESVLNEIELQEMPEVKEKTLLHLQCHFGLDTLSWARKGAKVTGVDLSPVAIDQAQEIAEKSQLKGEFICADVYDFGEQNSQQFDIVYTSYGALCWLPDIDRWAQTVFSALKPGGTFYIAEFHPLLDVHLGYSYFHKEEADIDEEGTYSENCPGIQHKVAVWAHPLSDVVTALIKVGLQIEFLHEFDFSPHNCFSGMIEEKNGQFVMKKDGHNLPLIYSIKAQKSILN